MSNDLLEKVYIARHEYTCMHCGKSNWNISIGHYEHEKKTTLILECSNSSCIEARRKELNLTDEDKNTLIIWGEYDITGQGCDPEDIIYSDEQLDTSESLN